MEKENAAAPSRVLTISQRTEQNFTVSDWPERYHPIQTVSRVCASIARPKL